MSYSVRYPRQTKEELEVTWATYPGLREQMTAWFGAVAERAEARDHSLSFDLTELATEVTEAAVTQTWGHAIRRFVRERASTQFWAFLTFLRTRRPPWEFRAISKTFIVSSSFASQITAYVEIDHVNRLVVFRYFEDLPGQG